MEHRGGKMFIKCLEPFFGNRRAQSQKREALRRDYTPDPGLWVRFMGEKFKADANQVWIEGHEDDARCLFVFPGEIKILQSYPDGVRVLDGHGENYFIYPLEDTLSSCTIQLMTSEDIRNRDEQWRQFYVKQN